ncbi:MAG: glutamate--tRNA ligase [Alphaproteobacteria bacterium]|nr:MAG: glutamate--tRNA ligase [Alphaproteobacteria bacterium]
MNVVTRFAPSPTGFLHIGGARTALFNWLFARHHGGRFLLRIEDTDRARSTPEATQAILDGLRWLGLDWDGEAVSQFARAARHAEVAHAMVEAGTAYRCYATREEIEAFREAERAAGRPPLFRSPWRERTDGPDAPYAIRLKAPREGETVVEDAVQGRVAWKNDTLDDLILLRSDGVPTYMLAVVVDDHDMGITHVIRGDDHLTNAARQTLIYRALGWQVPVFAHIPLIHGPDGTKLSKRHGALGLDAYRAMGFPPEAMRNYLARLGWSHGDDEFFTTEQAIAWYSLEGIGRAPARFDLAKLEHLSGMHIRAMAPERLLELLEEHVALQRGQRPDPRRREMLARALPAMRARARTLSELADMAQFILGERPFQPEPSAARHLTPEALELLRRLTERLRNASWTAEDLEAETRAFADAEEIKLGAIAQPLRVALTGRTVSPPIFDVMATLGREETLARIADATG